MFEDFGLKYVGLVDGYDVDVVEWVLCCVRVYGGLVFVYVFI